MVVSSSHRPAQGDALERGIAAIRAGQREQAETLLRQAVREQPHNEQAWLWLGGIMTNVEHRIWCLKRVLELNPENTVAQQGLTMLQQQARPPEHLTPPTVNSSTDEEAALYRPVALVATDDAPSFFERLRRLFHRD